MLITYDIGHGISTSGKRSPDGEREWYFCKTYSDGFVEQMKNYENVTVTCVSDITGKIDTPLTTRTNKANSLNSKCHISFHANANTGKWGTWGGVETFVYEKCSNTSEAYRLAQKVQTALVNASGLRNRGVKKGNLHMVRQTKMTAILVENGFYDSTTDIKVLRDTNKMKAIGKAIADAVASFYGLKKKVVQTVTPKPTNTVNTATTHTVVKGDTLWGISRKYGVTVDELKKWNGLTTNTLSIGQKLVVSNVKIHTVVKGDTLWGISRKYGVTVDELKKWNGLTTNTLSIGQKLIIK